MTSGARPKKARLPKAIWTQIILLLTTPKADMAKRQYCTQEQVDTLQSLRLVCKGLKHLVDPVFLQTVRISLDYESLDRIEQISRHPSLRQGVKAISVNLALYAGSIATDIRQYHKHIERFIDTQCEDCDWYSECRSYEDDDTSSSGITWRSWRDAEEQYHQIRRSWYLYLKYDLEGADLSGRPATEYSNIDQAYQDLLPECYQKYYQSYLDQQEILSTRSFTYTLAEAIARFPNNISLRIHDTLPSTLPPTRELCYNPTLLSKILTRPSQWHTAPPQDTHTHHPASLLLALPPLTDLTIEAFPSLPTLPSLLHPTNPNPKIWSNLATSLSNLTTFTFDPPVDNLHLYDQTTITPQQHDTIQTYFSAVLSSPVLKEISLNMKIFQTRIPGTRAQIRGYDITSLLRDKIREEIKGGVVLIVKDGVVERKELGKYKNHRMGMYTGNNSITRR